MSSFAAYLEIGGRQYTLYRYELAMHQETDTLGRPASPVLGGTINCTLSSPGNRDPFLYQWMLSPTAQYDGVMRLLDPQVGSTLKTISFFNAYCTSMDLSFQPGQQGSAGSSIIHLQISPQRIAVGAILHDNNWPVDSHGAGETHAEQGRQVENPSLNLENTLGVGTLGFVSPQPIPGEAIPVWTPKPLSTPPELPVPNLPEISGGLSGLAAAAVVFAAGALYPTPAGPADEWVAQLSPEDESRWAGLDLKRRQLGNQKEALTTTEYAEWLALDQRRYPHGRDANGDRPYVQRGTVNQNKLSEAEFQQALSIVDQFGGHIEGQKQSNEPGIDGHYNGTPVSLKSYEGTSPLGVLRHTSKAEQQAAKAGYSRVVVYVQAKNVSSDQLIDFAQEGGLKDIPNQGTVEEIVVKTMDGWVRIGATGITKFP